MKDCLDSSPTEGLVFSALRKAVQSGSTDLHVRSNETLSIRIDGRMRDLSLVASKKDIYKFLKNTFSARQLQFLQQRLYLNAAFNYYGNRFRLNASYSMGEPILIFRRIPNEVPNIDQLRIPLTVRNFIKKENGLLLVTGKAGSGKSTTLAAVADLVNQQSHKHIVTIEDPIEYIIKPKQSLITQKELGADVVDYPSAAREVLRQDPDIIIIGEIRDWETAQFALNAAETGHLVISTLHSVDSTEAIGRFLSLFPYHSQDSVRVQLSAVLRGIVCQKLLLKKEGKGRVPAFEILVASDRIRKLILEPSHYQDIYRTIEEGNAAYGMRTFDQSLQQILSENLISFQSAMEHAAQPGFFEMAREGVTSLDLSGWKGSPSQDSFKEEIQLAEPEPDKIRDIRRQGKIRNSRQGRQSRSRERKQSTSFLSLFKSAK